jgi:copper chaperone CopZ
MKTEDLFIANIKCGGCATTIKNELLKIDGVTDIQVFNEKDMITISYENVDRNVITQKLHSLGYPEATEQNGLLLQLKSYASCMLGKMDNLTK